MYVLNIDKDLNKTMWNLKGKVAEEICHGSAAIDPVKWLAQETEGLALRFSGLDEIPTFSILPLACLWANGELDGQALSKMTRVDPDTVDDYLEVLCEFGFVTETWNGFETTQKGREAFSAIGRNVIIRKRFELKGQLDNLEGMYKAVMADIDWLDG